MGRKKHQQSQPQSQRQLRVAEQVRHVLSQVFSEGKYYHPDIGSESITVTEVRISPDLRNATVYVIPFTNAFAEKKDFFIECLNEVSSLYRSIVNQQLRLKYSPRLRFVWDDTFDEANKIHSLLLSVGDSSMDVSE